MAPRSKPRSKETIEQDQGAILEQVYKAHTVGLSPVYPNSQQTEVSEQELRPQRAYGAPIPPGHGEKHPRRADLQSLVTQGKLETHIEEDWTSHATSNVGGNYIATRHKRSKYKLSQAQFDQMTRMKQFSPIGGHPYVPLGVHKPVRDEYDAGTTDEEMIEDRQQRGEANRIAFAEEKKRFQKRRESGGGRSIPAM